MFFLYVSCGIGSSAGLEGENTIWMVSPLKLCIFKYCYIASWGCVKKQVLCHVVYWWAETDEGFHNLGAFCLDELGVSLFYLFWDWLLQAVSRFLCGKAGLALPKIQTVFCLVWRTGLDTLHSARILCSLVKELFQLFVKLQLYSFLYHSCRMRMF